MKTRSLSVLFHVLLDSSLKPKPSFTLKSAFMFLYGNEEAQGAGAHPATPRRPVPASPRRVLAGGPTELASSAVRSVRVGPVLVPRLGGVARMHLDAGEGSPHASGLQVAGSGRPGCRRPPRLAPEPSRPAGRVPPHGRAGEVNVPGDGDLVTVL